MDAKSLLRDFYSILKKLPNYGKLLALASVATLMVAINPVVSEVKNFGYQYNRIVQKSDGSVGYRLPPYLTDKLPKSYVNTSKKPKVGDRFTILCAKDDDNKIYFYKQDMMERNDYDAWIEAVNDYRKSSQRKKMMVSFLFTAGLAFASYPGMIKRLLDLIPKK